VNGDATIQAPEHRVWLLQMLLLPPGLLLFQARQAGQAWKMGSRHVFRRMA